MKRLVVTAVRELNAAQTEAIRKTAEDCGFSFQAFATTEEAREDARDAEVILCQSQDLLPYASNLKWFASTNAGVENLLRPGVLPSEDCILTNGAGAYGVTISEHILMVTTCLLRNMPRYQTWMRQRYYGGDLPQRSIHGSRVTFLGTGDIGTTTAHAMRALGAARIVGLNRSGKKKSDDFDVVEPVGRVDRYLPDTDILILCMPNTPETVGVLSRERIAMLPEDAYVVNVGRGSAVDQDALIEALNAGRIAGAALDVTVPEPIPEDHPLWTTKNLLLTPHCAGTLTLGHTVQWITDLFCDNIRRYAAGEPMRNVVDRSRGY